MPRERKSPASGTLDEAARDWMTAVRASGRPAIQDLSPREMREVYAAGRAFTQLPPPGVGHVEDLTAPGEGGVIPLRLYRGIGANEGCSAFLLYLHGGGWVMGGLDSHDVLCRTIANRAGIAVVAIDYRLAPEHPFPAALNDTEAAMRFVLSQAMRLGLDPGRWAIGGDSAGGALAIAAALGLRDGDMPPPSFQLLIYPATRLTAEHAAADPALDGSPLTFALMRRFIELYADPEHHDDWRASPLLAPSLQSLPATLLLTAGYDPLCEEGHRFAQRLEQEGGRILHAHFSDQFHGFVNMGKVMPAADVALDLMAAELRRHLSNRKGHDT